MKITKVVTDTQGRTYQVDIIDRSEKEPGDFYLFVVHLRHRTTQVGIAKCFVNLDEKTMGLGNLMIYNEHEIQRTLIEEIKAFLLNDPKTYRQLGLGSKLLKIVIDKARESGVQRLQGRVTQQDFNGNPNLLNWYKKFGFCVEPPLPQDVSKDIARITLTLNQ